MRMEMAVLAPEYLVPIGYKPFAIRIATIEY